MQRILTLALMLGLMAVPAVADDNEVSLIMAIGRYNKVSLTDGSSVYTFNLDGSFHSEPLGDSPSGRIFDGRWTNQANTFSVIVKQTWRNGISASDDYRRLVFVVYNIRKRTPELFDGYFIIDELTKIDKPEGVTF